MHFGQCAPAFVFRNEVKGQETGRRIERSDRRAVDSAFMEVNAGNKWAERAPGQTQHLRRRIDAAEAPSGLRVGKGFQLQPAAGADDEHTRIVSNSFGEQQAGHLLEIVKARNLSHRAFGIAGDALRIGERQQR
jgi:hypothetical protein